MAEFSQLLNDRRSIRNYTDERVDLELVLELIQESTLAPNSADQLLMSSIASFAEVMSRTMDSCASPDRASNVVTRESSSSSGAGASKRVV